MSAEKRHKDLDFSELVELNKKLDRQLERFNVQKGSAQKSSRSVLGWKKIIGWLLLLVIAPIVPFVVLVRTSSYLYLTHKFGGWFALTMGVAATILLLLGYYLFVAYRYQKRFRIHKYVTRGIISLVLAYTLYGVLYYSSLHTKTDEINSYYRSLHPIMRVALTTITLADSDLIVTDIQRKPEDYTQMGLPENPESLHYVQSNGYVHAVDLRTRGRPEWKNWFMSTAFKLTGLKTLRHVGTTDHLHVYLPLNE